MKIAIAGYGVEGEQSYLYYSKDPNNKIIIVDEKEQPDRPVPEGVETMLGPGSFEKLEGFDLVVRTASLNPNKIKTDGKIWSATNEFFSKCPVQIVGVTGSKGKGTTCGMIVSILEQSGKSVWFVGNNGLPALKSIEEIKSDGIVVYELSSFQLWDIQYSPHVAVVLYIEQEHLDIHYDMRDYLQAKSQIVKAQTGSDIVIYNLDNAYSKEIAESSKAQKIGYPDSEHAHIQDGNFYYGISIICPVSDLSIIGPHNQLNACAAIDAVWQMGVTDIESIKMGLRSFTGLDHRLKLIREVDGIRYYDDSIATTPRAAIAAIHSFEDPKVIILGGSSKGSEFDELASVLKETDTKAILIGDEAAKIADACEKIGQIEYQIIEGSDMDEIVGRARHLLGDSGVVLLSPACASFGLYKNYEDRGNQFIEAVGKL